MSPAPSDWSARRSVARTARALVSRLPLVGVLRPPRRPAGITAVIRVKDEEEWLELAVRSVVGFADQIVVGDNGSMDGTPEIIARLVRELPDIVEALSLPDADICEVTNALIARARYRWIIRWDADFVGQTAGAKRMGVLRDWLLGLDPRRSYMVYPRMVELTGDFWHQDPANPTRGDAHCWTASPHVRYVYNPRGYESPRVPLWYEVRRWDTPCFFHVNVKSDERMFLSHVWKRFLLDAARPEAPTFDAYLARVLAEEHGGADLPSAARQWARRWMQRLVPLDPALADYPALLRRSLERPRYRLTYEEGRISGRFSFTCPEAGSVPFSEGRP